MPVKDQRETMITILFLRKDARYKASRARDSGGTRDSGDVDISCQQSKRRFKWPGNRSSFVASSPDSEKRRPRQQWCPSRAYDGGTQEGAMMKQRR